MGARVAMARSALRVPPCRLRNRSGPPPSGLEPMNDTPGLPSKTARKRSSTTMETWRSGRWACRISSAGVVRVQSPRERKRMMITRAPRGRRSITVGIGTASLLFDMGLINQHDGYIVTDRVNPLALHAFKPGLLMHELQGSLAQGTDEDVQ